MKPNNCLRVLQDWGSGPAHSAPPIRGSRCPDNGHISCWLLLDGAQHTVGGVRVRSPVQHGHRPGTDPAQLHRLYGQLVHRRDASGAVQLRDQHPRQLYSLHGSVSTRNHRGKMSL